MPTPQHRALVRLAAPATEPVTLTEVKSHLRIPHADDDSRLTDMIVTARNLAEQWLKRSLVTQSWKISLNEYALATTSLPMGPVQSITQVAYIARDGDVLIMDSNLYALNAAKDAIIFDNTPTGYQIDISYVAGYGAASVVPRPIKLGILEHISAMVDGTTTFAPMPDHVLGFYMPFRELRL